MARTLCLLLLAACAVVAAAADQGGNDLAKANANVFKPDKSKRMAKHSQRNSEQWQGQNHRAKESNRGTEKEAVRTADDSPQGELSRADDDFWPFTDDTPTTDAIDFAAESTGKDTPKSVEDALSKGEDAKLSGHVKQSSSKDQSVSVKLSSELQESLLQAASTLKTQDKLMKPYHSKTANLASKASDDSHVKTRFNPAKVSSGNAGPEPVRTANGAPQGELARTDEPVRTADDSTQGELSRTDDDFWPFTDNTPTTDATDFAAESTEKDTPKSVEEALGKFEDSKFADDVEKSGSNDQSVSVKLNSELQESLLQAASTLKTQDKLSKPEKLKIKNLASKASDDSHVKTRFNPAKVSSGNAGQEPVRTADSAPQGELTRADEPVRTADDSPQGELSRTDDDFWPFTDNTPTTDATDFAAESTEKDTPKTVEDALGRFKASRLSGDVEKSTSKEESVSVKLNSELQESLLQVSSRFDESGMQMATISKHFLQKV